MDSFLGFEPRTPAKFAPGPGHNITDYLLGHITSSMYVFICICIIVYPLCENTNIH